jgi:hypothetical protein
LRLSPLCVCGIGDASKDAGTYIMCAGARCVCKADLQLGAAEECSAQLGRA